MSNSLWFNQWSNYTAHFRNQVHKPPPLKIRHSPSQILLAASELWNQRLIGLRKIIVFSVICMVMIGRPWIFMTQSKRLAPGLYPLADSTVGWILSSLHHYPRGLSSPRLFSLNMSCAARSLVIHIKYSLVTFLFFKRSMIIANCNKRS